MQVRMLIKITGARDGQLWPDAGGVIDVPAHEAHDLVEVQRYAELVSREETPDAGATNDDVDQAAGDDEPTSTNDDVDQAAGDDEPTPVDEGEPAGPVKRARRSKS